MHEDVRREGNLLPLRRRTDGWPVSIVVGGLADAEAMLPPALIVLQGGLEEGRRPGTAAGGPELCLGPSGPGAA